MVTFTAHKHSGGFALIVVLAILASLTIFVTILSASSASQRRLMQVYADSIQRDALLDSALRMTLLRLTDVKGQAEGGQRLPSTQGIFGSDVSVVVEREGGRIDLNAAPQALIFSVFVAAGWEESSAKRAAAHIVNWRDADNNAQSRDAEMSEYKGAGLVYGPRNGPFESIGELQQVLAENAFTEDILNAFTVYTHVDIPDQTSAPPVVMNALRYAQKKHLDDRSWIDQKSEDFNVNRPDFRVGEVLRLRACVTLKSAEQVCRQVVVRLTGKESNPFQVFWWSDAI